MDKTTVSDRIDPDPFAVTGLVIAAVSMFAQLAALAKQIDDGSPGRRLETHNIFAIEKMGEEVENAIRETEKLIKLLARMDNGLGGTPLSAKFRFGEVEALVGVGEMPRYVENVRKIGLAATNIAEWAHSLIQSGTGEIIGKMLLTRVDGIQSRINRLFDLNMTYEDVLDECLQMLRSFHSICESVAGLRN